MHTTTILIVDVCLLMSDIVHSLELKDSYYLCSQFSNECLCTLVDSQAYPGHKQTNGTVDLTFSKDSLTLFEKKLTRLPFNQNIRLQ